MCFCVHVISIVYIIVCVRVCFFPFSVFLETHMRGMKQICFMIKSVTIRRIIYINRSSRYAFPGLLCTDHSPCRKINNSWGRLNFLLQWFLIGVIVSMSDTNGIVRGMFKSRSPMWLPSGKPHLWWSLHSWPHEADSCEGGFCWEFFCCLRYISDNKSSLSQLITHISMSSFLLPSRYEAWNWLLHIR